METEKVSRGLIGKGGERGIRRGEKRRGGRESTDIVPLSRVQFGDRAFTVNEWNSLPAAVCKADSLYSFKRKLKTDLVYFMF